MPAIDLRGIKIGEYKNNDGTVTYEAPISMGEAMTAQLELTFAEDACTQKADLQNT